MNAEQTNLLFVLLREGIFYLKVLCISTSFLAGFAFFQMFIHSKNQRNLI